MDNIMDRSERQYNVTENPETRRMIYKEKESSTEETEEGSYWSGKKKR